MTPFDELHPALQHHIVNSLGWRNLRPHQEEAIRPILAGQHALVLAPTAGGKTEAVTFPVLSRMLTEDWCGLSVLYVCPIKALLNNLAPRLERYAGYVGRRVGLWHGDILESARNRYRSDPPDFLLTTPESIESILISTRSDHRALLGHIQVVIVDELHAFAGDDRGWHLLMLLERLNRICGKSIQRIGLSATVGNPEQLLSWLARDLSPGRKLIGTTGKAATDAAIQVDHVGSIENASYVLSRLYRGEKRLVFADSRSKVEKLAAGLRHHGTRTFVSHSSLSRDERQQAEGAFAVGSDCIIVATSTLELGLDIGDLDRVIQIDAPGSVSSFLQRMGRSGRRADSRRNCLFLTTTDESFLFACGLIRLWLDGYVEPVNPPSAPWHLFAQQIMALCLQEGGLALSDWRRWIGELPLFAKERPELFSSIVEFMLAMKILSSDNGVLWLGPEGEKHFGRRHFSEIVTSFTTPLLINVRCGKAELGQVDPVSLRGSHGESPIVVLSGRSWLIKQIDWRSRTCWAEPASQAGRSRWMGSSVATHFQHCQAIARVIPESLPNRMLSRRAARKLSDLQHEFESILPGKTTLAPGPADTVVWWTFAGARANSLLVAGLSNLGCEVAGSDNFKVIFKGKSIIDLRQCIKRLPSFDEFRLTVTEQLLSELKFNECLPESIGESIIRERQSDFHGMGRILEMPVMAAV